MSKKYDVLGVGIAAVDDLIYVSDYPQVDCKVPVHGSTRQGGGPACTAIAAVGSLGDTPPMLRDLEATTYPDSSNPRLSIVE